MVNGYHQLIWKKLGLEYKSIKKKNEPSTLPSLLWLDKILWDSPLDQYPMKNLLAKGLNTVSSIKEYYQTGQKCPITYIFNDNMPTVHIILAHQMCN